MIRGGAKGARIGSVGDGWERVRDRGLAHRDYPESKPGTRAEGRGESRLVTRWEAPDGSLHRTRKAAARIGEPVRMVRVP